MLTQETVKYMLTLGESHRAAYTKIYYKHVCIPYVDIYITVLMYSKDPCLEGETAPYINVNAIPTGP